MKSTATELPETLPETGEVRLIRAIAAGLYQQVQPGNQAPLDPLVADVLLNGLVSWMDTGSWEAGLGLAGEGGRNPHKDFWLVARDMHLAEALGLLDVPDDTALAPRCKALLRELQTFEKGRYQAWRNSERNQAPPEASALQHALFKVLKAAKHTNGYPSSLRRLQEAVRRGTVSLLDSLK